MLLPKSRLTEYQKHIDNWQKNGANTLQHPAGGEIIDLTWDDDTDDRQK